jgi:hypothetical protein
MEQINVLNQFLDDGKREPIENQYHIGLEIYGPD